MARFLSGKWQDSPLFALRAVVALVGGYALFLVFSMAQARIGYAGELEWMEGGIWGHVLRVADGLPLYVEPSVEFTPYIYTPLYYWVCAGFGGIFGQSIGLLRLVSLVSFALTCAIIALFVRRKTGKALPGAIGAGLFAATFRLGGAWFDIARGDSFAVMLLLLGATLLLCYECRKSAVVAGLTLTAAFLTKQSCLLPLLLLVFWSLLCRTPRLLWFAGVAVSALGMSWAALHFTSSGWFSYYVFTLPAAHPLLDDWKILFWKNDVLGVLSIGSLLLLFECLASIKWERPKWLESLGFFVFAAGTTGMAWSSRFHLGMYDNVLMPLHALIGLGVGLSLGRIQKLDASWRTLEVASLLAIAGTFWKLEYPVEAQVPTAAHVRQYEQLLERIKQLPRGTWVAYHSTPTIQTNNPPRSHWMALIDVQRGGEGPQAQKLRSSAHKWLAARTAPAIVWSLRDPTDAWFHDEMRKHYRRAGRISGPSPLTGWGQRPTEIWIPRPKPAQ